MQATPKTTATATATEFLEAKDLLGPLFDAVETAHDAVEAAETDREREKAHRAVNHAEFLLEEAKKRFSAKGSASGESPPHSPTYCRERPCHRLVYPFLHSHSCACALSHGALLDVATTTPPWHCVLLLSHTRRTSATINH
jgi:hypothetical protein